MNLFVSNLGFDVQDDELRQLFEPFGAVSSAKIIMDRATGRSRGFGFVEMPDDAAAKKAISELNGSQIAGRPVSISEARPKEPGRGNGGGGGRW